MLVQKQHNLITFKKLILKYRQDSQIFSSICTDKSGHLSTLPYFKKNYNI